MKSLIAALTTITIWIILMLCYVSILEFMDTIFESIENKLLLALTLIGYLLIGSTFIAVSGYYSILLMEKIYKYFGLKF